MKCYLLKTFVVIYMCILLLALVSCKKFEYQGDYSDLYTVAVNSLIGSKGSIVGEVRFQPLLEIVDEDRYGRMLFAYSEKDEFGISLLISQKNYCEEVYFYEDKNFISKQYDEQLTNGNSLLTAFDEKFSVEEINSLKFDNDWDKEFNINKCIKKKIVLNKPETPKEFGKDFNNLFKKSFGYDGEYNIYRFAVYVTLDNYGRSMYLGYGVYPLDYGKSEWVYLIIIINPDNTFNESCTMVLTDFFNYQNELKLFKEQNNWNKLY